MHPAGKLALLAALGVLLASAVPVSTKASPRATDVEVNKTIDRAVAFLKKNQAPDGTWYHQQAPLPNSIYVDQNLGATALCAIALLEAGVDRDDPVIQRAVAAVRARARELDYTYSIAAVLLLLDRVDTGKDSSTVVFLAQKLIRGQYPSGGWSYYCSTRGPFDDNSNTQFAILALWIARYKHKFPAENALRLAEQRFRQSQQVAGGWGYNTTTSAPPDRSTPSMTCAGLLALAIGFALKEKGVAQLVGGDPNAPAGAPPRPPAPNPINDPQIRRALDYLAQVMSQPMKVTHLSHSLYFLWSLERVGMIYGFTKINGIDWYEWGAQALVESQLPNGSWAYDVMSGANCETAWALLFLRKADLTGGMGKAIFEHGNLAPPRKAAPIARKPVEDRRKGVPGEAAGLRERLRKTIVAEEVEETLELLEKTVGSEYTDALVDAIGEVTNSTIKGQIRQALERRLQRMKETALSGYLETGNKEELRLAALAAISKRADSRKLIPEVIPLLDDRDAAISTRAYETLKQVSGKDHGRNAGAWRQWWEDGGK